MKILIANLKPDRLFSGTTDEKMGKYSTLHFPLGLGIVAAVLKRSGRDFRTFDSYVGRTNEDFLADLKRDNPDIIMLSGFLGNYSYAFFKEMFKQIKHISPKSVIVIGGPIATTIPEILVSRTEVDIVVKGEGERTVISLLDTLSGKSDISSVIGIYYRDKQGGVVYTGDGARIENLDDYPFPAYDAFEIKSYIQYLNETGRCWEIAASRGCYGRCGFCKLTFGQKITSYSCRAVVDHMISVSQNYGIDRFNFVDDNFLNSHARIDEFVAILENTPKKFRWRFQGRADHILPGMVKRMARAGLFDISFGIESGSSEMLARYMKNLDIKKAAANISAIKDIVDIHATFIVGGPGESWKTIKETEQFIRQLKLKNVGVGILTLFPATLFYQEAVRNGAIEDEEAYCMNLGPVFDRPYVNVSSLSDEELLQARDMLENAALEFKANVKAECL